MPHLKEDNNKKKEVLEKIESINESIIEIKTEINLIKELISEYLIINKENKGWFS